MSLGALANSSQHEEGPNPVLMDALYAKIRKEEKRMAGSERLQKHVYSRLCRELIAKAKEGITVSNHPYREGAEISLSYKRALQKGQPLRTRKIKEPIVEVDRVFAKLPALLEKCIKDKTNFDASGVPGSWQFMSAVLARHYGVGRCGELSHIIFVEAMHWSALLGFNIEIARGDNYNHMFTIFNRDPSTNIQRPATWNDGAVICDAWLGEPWDPKKVITDSSQATNNKLTPNQRQLTVGRSAYLHQAMPRDLLPREDAKIPHNTLVTRSSRDARSMSDLARDHNLWDETFARGIKQCAVQIDQQVFNHLSKVASAREYVKYFRPSLRLPWDGFDGDGDGHYSLSKKGRADIEKARLEAERQARKDGFVR